MANPNFVSSVNGDNADDGSTAALANATIVGAMTDSVAGDRTWVSDAHAESTASSITITMPGTLASPTQIYCGDFSTEPPTAVNAFADVTTTGASAIAINGVGVIEGIQFFAGTGSSSFAGILLAQADGNFVSLRNCLLSVIGTHAACKIQLGVTTGAVESRVELESVNVRLSNASQSIDLRHCKFHWQGGSMIAGTSPTTLITLNGDTFDCLIENVNFSAMAAGINIFASSSVGVGLGRIRNCRLPASWSGSLGQPTGFNTRYEMWNCSADDSIVRVRIADVMGVLQDEETVVRSGGATDGTTAFSHRVVTSTSAEFPSNRFEGPENFIDNTTVGSSVTITVEILHDSVGAGTAGAFQDDELALEVMYPGTSGFPIYTKVTSAKSNSVGAASDYASSSVTWDTTGHSTPLKQKMSVTFTPQEAGDLIWRIVAFKASKTFHYCPDADKS